MICLSKVADKNKVRVEAGVFVWSPLAIGSLSSGRTGQLILDLRKALASGLLSSTLLNLLYCQRSNNCSNHRLITLLSPFILLCPFPSIQQPSRRVVWRCYQKVYPLRARANGRRRLITTSTLCSSFVYFWKNLNLYKQVSR